MQRHLLQSVTSMPTLLPCKLGEEDGFVDGDPVRIVDKDEIIGGYHRWKESPSKPKDHVDWGTLGGLHLLKRALENKDLSAGRHAVRMLEPFLKTIIKPAPDEPRAAEAVMQFINSIPFEVRGEQWMLPRLINRAVKGARPCVWIPGKAIRRRGEPGALLPFNPPQPAMLCPTFEIAVAYALLFDGLRVCLRCQSLFVPKHPKQQCCKVECREAHRMARWRERKKLQTAARESKKKK